ncbi:MAG TPA: twin-arginine translocation signal domain-containing protein [Actinocrinis sp.]|nr:twin-arginine translocation signal domain-containing protein [Actinocrinis sp.]
MTDQSRRKFLQATSIGGAAAGAAVILPRLSARPATASAASAQAAGAVAAPAFAPAGAAHTGPFVAYVKNAKTGEIAVLAGENEVVHYDPQLAARLAQVASRTVQA